MTRAPDGEAGPDRATGAVVLGLFALVALVIYSPALHGEFVSDDHHYLWRNPAVSNLSWESALDILAPFGTATMSVINYEPVHLLWLAVEVELFGRNPLGYHVVDVLVHAANAWLLLLLLLRAGIGRWASLAGAGLFLVHPANVEAVAWITQLKTTGSFLFTAAALLALPRRPALATAAFAVALLIKAQAIVALPVAAAFSLSFRSGAERPSDGSRIDGWPLHPRWAWLGLWCAIAAIYAATELAIFGAASESIPPLHEDALLNAANIAVVAGRYLFMATTTLGLSTFHQPDAIERIGDPRVWLSLLALVAIGARTIVAARRRSPELAFWLFAIVSFLPVSQILPFLHPIGDRYLYFQLPGLIGAGLLCAEELFARTSAGRAGALSRAWTLRIGAVVALVAVAGCAARSYERAAIWSVPGFVFADSAKNYPMGLKAHVLRGRTAAARGDVDGVVEAFEAARGRGFTGLGQLMQDPVLRRFRGEPRYDAFLESLARDRIAHFEAQQPTQIGLSNLAFARQVVGDREGAIAALELARTLPGPMEEKLVRNLAALRASAPRPAPHDPQSREP